MRSSSSPKRSWFTPVWPVSESVKSVAWLSFIGMEMDSLSTSPWSLCSVSLIKPIRVATFQQLCLNLPKTTVKTSALVGQKRIFSVFQAHCRIIVKTPEIWKKKHPDRSLRYCWIYLDIASFKEAGFTVETVLRSTDKGKKYKLFRKQPRNGRECYVCSAPLSIALPDTLELIDTPDVFWVFF